MSKIGQELDRLLDLHKYELLEALNEVAIPSLKYCEDKYGHDDMARLNLQALVNSIRGGDAYEVRTIPNILST